MFKYGLYFPVLTTTNSFCFACMVSVLVTQLGKVGTNARPAHVAKARALVQPPLDALKHLFVIVITREAVQTPTLGAVLMGL
jgi:hypothetical protein